MGRVVGAVRVAGEWVSQAELRAMEALALEAERNGQYNPPRDAVTGELLSEEALHQYTIRADHDPRPLPKRMHISQPAEYRGPQEGHKYWHGGPEWARDWLAYIGNAVPVMVAAEREQRAEWWTCVYACKLVQQELGERALAAILAWKAAGMEYHVVTRRYAKGRQGWLDRQYRKATNLVHREVFDAPRQPRPSRAA